MIVLAIETGGAGIAAAALEFGAGVRTLFSAREAFDRGHAARLIPFLQEQLSAAGLAVPTIGLFVGSTGPGSFTGLRVGLAALAGLALACDRPIVGISGFEGMRATACAESVPDLPLLVALDGRRPEPFTLLLDARGRPLGPPANPDRAALHDMLPPGRIALCGDGAALVRCMLPERDDLLLHPGPIDPAALARLGHRRRGEAGRGPPPPLYVRPPDARPLPP
jgi:tRNA threonylcarbamoyladenosine biosynthesis protein TsaB